MNPVSDREFIRGCLPHGEGMCLLDRVLDYSDEHIVCAGSLAADHPLASSDGLHAVHALEYAAQATAVHGALLDGVGAPRSGVIASVRALVWVRPLVQGKRLEVRCTRVLRQSSALAYDFELADAVGTAVNGRVMVAFPETA